MHFSTLLSLAVGAQAINTGFNYGNMLSDGTTPKTESMYEAEFKRAQTLQGTNGEFTSGRLYTMIQGGTTDTPIAAIQAAINTNTTLLLGLWASQDQSGFQNEINALNAAVQQYGSDFTKLVVGISVGSEDLYRDSPTGIQNDAGIGQTPDVLVSYIKQTRSAIQSTGLSNVQVGHVDTWTAYVNSSNNAVIDACDWLGMDTYPYFQTTVVNTIGTSNKTFWDAYEKTVQSGNGKEVWITETGWPVSGNVSGQAVPSVQNAETYWQEVACSLLGNYNTWWYTLQDAEPTTPNPSFGIVGSDLNSAPLYDLTCKKTKSSSGSSSGGSSNHGGSASGGISGSNGTAPGHASPAGGSGSGTSSGSSSSSSASASPSNNAAPKGAAISAGILAIFGLVATL